MRVAATMIGAAGEYTFSGVAQRRDDGRFACLARVFDHPDPSISLPSGTTPRHLVEADGATLDEATAALEASLAALIGPLQWVRWRPVDERAQKSS